MHVYMEVRGQYKMSLSYVLFFYIKKSSLTMCMSLCVCAYECGCPGSPEASDPPGAEVAGSCEQLCMGAKS